MVGGKGKAGRWGVWCACGVVGKVAVRWYGRWHGQGTGINVPPNRHTGVVVAGRHNQSIGVPGRGTVGRGHGPMGTINCSRRLVSVCRIDPGKEGRGQVRLAQAKEPVEPSQAQPGSQYTRTHPTPNPQNHPAGPDPFVLMFHVRQVNNVKVQQVM